MKKTIIRLTEQDLHNMIRQCIKEVRERWYTDDSDPLYYEYLGEYDEAYILRCFKENPKENNMWRPLINPAEYQKALDEFVQYGKIMRFPTNKIYQWMGICLKNIALLRANSSICGHSSYADTDSFVDIFFDGDYDAWDEYCKEIGEHDWGAEITWLEKNGFDEWDWSAGLSSTISDYGVEPLERLAAQYKEDMSPEDTLVLINKMLDVTHQNGDLSQLFIQGGAGQLDRISNSHYYGPM